MLSLDEKQIMKFTKITVGFLLLMFGGFFVMYQIYAPKIIVENLADESVKLFVVNVPRTNISFKNVGIGSTHLSRHSPFQNDGTYRYKIEFESASTLSGECGYISSGGFGESFRFTIRSTTEVICNK